MSSNKSFEDQINESYYSEDSNDSLMCEWDSLTEDYLKK